MTNAIIDCSTITHDHKMFEVTVERAKKLFLEGWRVTLGLSGKDSGAASICLVEGLKRACEVNRAAVAGLHFVTTDTHLDNMVLADYMIQLHEDAINFAKNECSLPIFSELLRPALSVDPLIEYVGRGKILRTPETTSSKGRSCAIDWKLRPMMRFIKELQVKYRTTKIIAISGSRDSESSARAGNLAKRGENADKMVITDLGWSQPIIKDWSLSDVWQLFKIVDDGDIESYSPHFNLMKKHYAAGNSGTCDLFSGDLGKSNKECGSRFGCTLCAMTKDDKSLDAQIAISPKTYGFMAGLSQLRTFMVNTLFDYQRCRSVIGRKIDENGFVKIAPNQYSLAYRQELLRYILTIQVEVYEKHGSHLIDLIDYRELVAIQYHWCREGGEQSPGTAFQIWHEIVNNGERYYIPKTTKAEINRSYETKYFDLQGYVDHENPQGLDDEGLTDRFKSIARQYFKDGSANRVVSFSEGQTFEVITKDALAMTFIEDFFISLILEGNLSNKCPTVMLKHMLQAGVLVLKKGQIARLNEETKRAQMFNALCWSENATIENGVVSLAVSVDEMENISALRKAQAIEPQYLLL